MVKKIKEEIIVSSNNLKYPLIGQKMFDFALEALYEDKIKKIKFSDYLGKWLILFFYPADFTFVCPTELKELADNYQEFKKNKAEILSISTDTIFVHKAWHDNSETIKKIRFPMVADPTGKLCCVLGTYLEDEGISLRATFIVDPDGVIRSYEINDNSVGRSAAELLRKLKAAMFVREHKGEVCPASWQPGRKTLKPSLDLVGKI